MHVLACEYTHTHETVETVMLELALPANWTINAFLGKDMYVATGPVPTPLLSKFCSYTELAIKKASKPSLSLVLQVPVRDAGPNVLGP